MCRFFSWLFLGSITVYNFSLAQTTSAERVAENAKWKAENKVNQKVDKAIDDVLDGNIFKKKPKNGETAADSIPAASG
nr:hypothetical protein [Chitinophagaceae bacterium]